MSGLHLLQQQLSHLSQVFGVGCLVYIWFLDLVDPILLCEGSKTHVEVIVYLCSYRYT